MYSTVNSFQSILFKYNLVKTTTPPSTGGVTYDWKTMVASTNGIIYASAYDPVSNMVYIGGNFTTVSDSVLTNQSAKYIAVWNVSLSRFSCLGNTYGAAINGTNNIVYAMFIDSANRLLYIGGGFTATYDGSLNGLNARLLAIYNLTISRFYSFGVYNSATNGVNSTVYALTGDLSNQIIYAGGIFTTYSDLSYSAGSAKCVCGWNINNQRFFPFGVVGSTLNGLNSPGYTSQVNALAVDVSNQTVYIGGYFFGVSDMSYIAYVPYVNNIARYNVKEKRFAPVRYGLDNTVRTLTIDTSNSILYIGGDFTQSNQSSGNVFSTTTNTCLIGNYDRSKNNIYNLDDYYHTGCTGQLNTSIYDASNNVVYMGGASNFTVDRNGQLSGNIYVVTWDLKTKQFIPMGNPGRPTFAGPNGTVSCMAHDVSNGLLYMAGAFTTTYDSVNNGTVVTNRICVYNLTTKRYSPLGGVSTNNGLNGVPYSLALDTSNNILYIAGNCNSMTIATNPNGTTVACPAAIVSWNIITQTFSLIGITSLTVGGGYAYTSALALDMSNQILYVGGYFANATDSIGAKTPKCIYALNLKTTVISYLGASGAVNGIFQIAANGVYSLYYDSFRKYLYFGGTFSTTFDSYNNGVQNYVNSIGIWDISNSKFLPLTDGINTNANGVSGASSRIHTLAFEESTGNLYYGGEFLFSNVVDCSNLMCYYDISKNIIVSMPGIGVNGNLLASGAGDSFIDVSNDILYMAAQGLTTVYDPSYPAGLSCKGIAGFNLQTNRFFCLGNTNGSTINGIGGITHIFKMVPDFSRNIIYIAGQFTTVSDGSFTNLSAQNIVSYNLTTQRFTPLGVYNSTNNGTNNLVYDITLDASNNILYLGGSFTSVIDADGTTTVGYIASWNVNTSRFSYMGNTAAQNGVGPVNANITNIKYLENRNRVYLSGNFSYVYDASGFVAQGAVTWQNAFWDIPTQRYLRVGDIANSNAGGQAACMYYDASNGVIYNFSIANDASGNAQFSGTTSYDISRNRFCRLGGTDPKLFAYNASVCPNGNSRLSVFNNDMDFSSNIWYFSTSGDQTNDSNNYQYYFNAYGGGYYDITNRVWQPLGTLGVNGFNNCNTVTRLVTVDKKRNRVFYIGGRPSGTFVSTNGTNANINVPGITISTKHIGCYNINTKKYSALGNQDGNHEGVGGPTVSVGTIAILPNNIIFGGYLATLFSTDWCPTANYIIGYNISDDSYFQLGGKNTANDYNNGVDYYAKRNTTTFFSSLPSIIRTSNSISSSRASVSSLTVDISNRLLYVGGSFTHVRDPSNNGQAANNFAVWDISNQIFYNTGKGVDASVNTITLGNLDNGSLLKYVGGNFTNSYGLTGTKTTRNYFAIGT
jgi:hypothetical protein